VKAVHAVLALLGAAIVALAVLAPAHPAGAQEGADGTGTSDGPPPGVRISFDTGGFDAGNDRFLIEAVVVEGGLREGEDFTVELRGAGGGVLWSATRAYNPPSTRIELDAPVAVNAVDSAAVFQAELPTVVEAVPPQAPAAMEGSGGSGQLTLSMVVTMIVLLVVFRSPLPSAQTSRWTK
jgi:hypothetical protein